MIRKIILTCALSLLTPLTSLAQSAVFKCEENGHTAWSEYPCKSKGKAVRIKKLGNGKSKAAVGNDTSKFPEKSPSK